MTDLQCPAGAVLLGCGAPPPPWLARLRVAERFEATGWANVLSLVDETADLFRGETFVVAAPPADVVEALRRRGVAGRPPVLVEVDSGGWRLVTEP
ncbi:hypothetical protein [Arthrobacter sp. G119Y2]|uniref:hypothetical protein n=1 Tax=Arthrobacter sp. G119Y2 TaxID=3134965 RepID=UPI0031197426